VPGVHFRDPRIDPTGDRHPDEEEGDDEAHRARQRRNQGRPPVAQDNRKDGGGNDGGDFDRSADASIDPVEAVLSLQPQWSIVAKLADISSTCAKLVPISKAARSATKHTRSRGTWLSLLGPCMGETTIKKRRSGDSDNQHQIWQAGSGVLVRSGSAMGFGGEL